MNALEKTLRRVVTCYISVDVRDSRFIRDVCTEHQQKTFPSRRNGSVRVDALSQTRQRHPGGGLLRA